MYYLCDLIFYKLTLRILRTFHKVKINRGRILMITVRPKIAYHRLNVQTGLPEKSPRKK